MRVKERLYDQITSMDNLVGAFDEVSRTKRYEYDFQEIEYFKWEILIEIQNELVWKCYKPGKTDKFIDPGPPPRNITSPMLKDRIIHHAIIRVILPYLENYFDYDSYACRAGKGTLLACKRLQQFYRSAIGKWGYKNFFVIKGDFKKFFPTLNHDFAVYMYRKIFNDEDVVNLMETIIRYYEGGEELFEYGEPIGFLTTQHTGNLVGTAIDHYVKSELKQKYYLRLVDDFRILVETRDEAEEILDKIDHFVQTKMMQQLSPTKTKIVRAKAYDVFCGYKVYPHHFEPKTATVRRLERHIGKKINKYKKGKIDLKKLEDTCDCYTKSYLAHTTQKTTQVIADAYNFIALEKVRLGIKEKDKRCYNNLPVRKTDW